MSERVGFKRHNLFQTLPGASSTPGLFLCLMANRMLKDWTCSEKMDKLTVNAEVFFVRLIMKADDFGCFFGNTKIIKAQLYPLKEVDDSSIEDSIDQCRKAGLIQCYQSDGKRYLKIHNFGQRMRSMKSKFPQPVDTPQTNDGDAQSDDNQEPPEGSGSGSRSEGQHYNSDDYYTDAQKAFEILKNDEMFVEKTLIVIHGRGLKAATKIDVMLKLKEFLKIEDAKETITTRPSTEVKQHFINWVNKQK